MYRIILKAAALALATVILSACSGQKDTVDVKSHVIIAYVGGYQGEVDASRISADKITHINYAFVNLVDGRATLTNEKTDTINFRKLNALKTVNPHLKILISIGGWTWSGLFSDAVLTEEGRKLFASSSADIVKKYDLDGVDIDWEYPGFGGMEGNIYRPEDKQNYTLMFKALRESLDSLTTVTGKKYLLTTAVGGFEKYTQHTEMDKCAPYLDYINLMTYDYFPDKIARHHTNMYPSKEYECNYSGQYAVEAFMRAGVPAEKLVVGIAFYSRAFEIKDGNTKGLGDSVGVYLHKSSGGFTHIKDSIENRNGFVKHWDASARAPYLYNAEKKMFITYDDEQSVKEKCLYTVQNGLAGVMFWEYSSDPKEYLLDAINEAYGNSDPANK